MSLRTDGTNGQWSLRTDGTGGMDKQTTGRTDGTDGQRTQDTSDEQRAELTDRGHGGLTILDLIIDLLYVFSVYDLWLCSFVC